jgi:hypothetical protein
MDFATIAPAIERAALVYALRHDEPEVEAAYDALIEAMLSDDAPPPGAAWVPSPEWYQRVKNHADGFNRQYGQNA